MADPVDMMDTDPEQLSDYWTVLQENKSGSAQIVSPVGRTSVLVFGGILTIWSLCLHGLLLLVLAKRRRRKGKRTGGGDLDKFAAADVAGGEDSTALHWLLTSLTLGDVLLIAVALPVELITEQAGAWTLGASNCKWWRPAHIGLLALYLWGHLAVIIERYLACLRMTSSGTVSMVTRGAVGGGRSGWAVGLGVSGVWLLALGSAVVVMVTVRGQDAMIDEICAMDMSSMDTTLVLAFAAYFAPAALIVTATVLLLLARCRLGISHSQPLFDHSDYCPEEATIAAQGKANEAYSTGGGSLGRQFGAPDHVGSGSDALLVAAAVSASGDLAAVRRRLCGSVRISLLAVAVCLGVWAPFFVTSVVVPFCGRHNTCVDPTLWTLSLWVGYSGLGITPIVWYFEPSVRAKAKEILG